MTEGYPQGDRPTNPEDLSRRRLPDERPVHYDIDVLVYGATFYRLASYNAATDTVETCLCCCRCGPETVPWDDIDGWRYEYQKTEDL